MISVRRIVVTKEGLVYNSYLSYPNTFLFWRNMQNYYILSSEKSAKGKIIIDYYNKKFKLNKLSLGIDKKDEQEIDYIFKEFIKK